MKQTESNQSTNKKTILFFGNSLTAAYGLANPEDGFTGLIHQRLDSLGMEYTVVNAGLSGETTTAGLNRLGWVLKQSVDIFVLELGANDGLRGIPPASTKENLQAMIKQVEETHPEAKILFTGMMVPPNMGDDYAVEFRKLFKEVAEANDVVFLPFLLDGVAGEIDLNQRDGIHPTEEGHQIVMENVWAVLKDML
ncbi:MAG: arylesterase [Bacteroidota bacterium]